MELKPRFTTGIIKQLFKDHKIDLFVFKGEYVMDQKKRMIITLAGMPDAKKAEIDAACDAMTPGEHIELVTLAVRDSLLPPSLREADAGAATPTKSE